MSRLNMRMLQLSTSSHRRVMNGAVFYARREQGLLSRAQVTARRIQAIHLGQVIHLARHIAVVLIILVQATRQVRLIAGVIIILLEATEHRPAQCQVRVL